MSACLSNHTVCKIGIAMEIRSIFRFAENKAAQPYKKPSKIRFLPFFSRSDSNWKIYLPQTLFSTVSFVSESLNPCMRSNKKRDNSTKISHGCIVPSLRIFSNICKLGVTEVDFRRQRELDF